MSWVTLIAAIIISVLVFTFLVRVVKAAIGTAIAIAIVVLILQVGFGVNLEQLRQAVWQLWENFWQQFGS